jgi:hypothetical protein
VGWSGKLEPEVEVADWAGLLVDMMSVVVDLVERVLTVEQHR